MAPISSRTLCRVVDGKELQYNFIEDQYEDDIIVTLIVDGERRYSRLYPIRFAQEFWEKQIALGFSENPWDEPDTDVYYITSVQSRPIDW